MDQITVRAFSRRTLSWVMAGMLLIAILANGAQAQQPSSQSGTPSAESIEKGKRNFVTYLCFACRGYSGQGAETGPRLDTNRLPFEAFSRYVRQPGGSMPRYGSQKQIPDAALEEIYVYLKSVPPSPDPKSIPILND